jgi:AbiV family abortive infection protein
MQLLLLATTLAHGLPILLLLRHLLCLLLLTVGERCMVTDQFLLKGSVYALEQCGLLLRDATTLFKAGSYAGSIVMAAHAREELDRAILLRELRERVLTGLALSVADINQELEEHADQRLVRVSASPRAEADPELDELLQARLYDAPRGQKHQQADLFFEHISKEQAERTRNERHALLERCLHVGPESAGTHWHKPKAHSRERARHFLTEVLGDYAGERDRIETGLCHPKHAEFVNAVRAWAGRPDLPPPAWASW